MPGQRPILAMSFIASLGVTFEVLACTLPKGQGNFWPMTIYLFYLLLPVPLLISKRAAKDPFIGNEPADIARVHDYASFITAGIIVSSMALPIVLARSPAEHPTIAVVSCILVEIGNLLCFATMALFYIYFKPSS